MCIKKCWNSKLYIKKSGSINKNNLSRNDLCSTLFTIFIGFFPALFEKCATWEAQKRNAQHLDHRLFFTKPQTRHCAYRRKGAYSRARLTDDEDARSCMNYSRASRNRHRNDRWTPRFGVSRAVFQKFLLAKKKKISYCTWRPVKKFLSKLQKWLLSTLRE